MEDWHLIVGLGNPGADYAKTRHNAGFMLADLLAKRWRADWSAGKKFQSRVAKAERDGRRVMLYEPHTFMNASGEAVRTIVKFYRLPLKNLIVAMDDADLPLGEIRLRRQGSSGGHRGLKSIEQQLGSREYARLRVGIGRAPGAAREITDHVLGRFTAEESALLKKVLDRAADQIECWLKDGIAKAMSQFNGAAQGSEREDKQ